MIVFMSSIFLFVMGVAYFLGSWLHKSWLSRGCRFSCFAYYDDGRRVSFLNDNLYKLGRYPRRYGDTCNSTMIDKPGASN